MSLATDFILKYQDRRNHELVNATDLLANRINSIRRAKSQENAAAMVAGKPVKYKNVEPTINDVIQSHRLYVVRKYMPFVSMAYQYFKVGSETGAGGLVNGEQTIRFALRGNQGHFIHDMYVNIAIDAIGDESDDTIKYQYCDYPGVRLIKKYAFNVREGFQMDEYSSDNVILQTQNFKTNTNNRGAWDCMVGQEEQKEAQHYHPDYSMKQSFFFRNGAQTPRARQPVLEMWIPLQFWFNKDFGQAFPLAAINNEQTNIEITIESLSRIIRATNRNGDVVPLSLTKLKFNKCDLYTNNIFLDDVVFEPVFSRGIRQLIRVNREQRHGFITSTGALQLKKMEFALEELYFGFRPKANLNYFDRWHLFSDITTEEAAVPVIIQEPGLPAQKLVVRTATIKNLAAPTDSISFHIQGKLIITDHYHNKFYACATPYRFDKLNSPTDPGSMMLAFNVDPTEYNPNGHLSLRNNHELTVEYVSRTIAKDNPTELVLVGKSINFLVIRNQEATLEQIS